MEEKRKLLPAVLAVCLLTAVFCGCGKKKEVLLPPTAAAEEGQEAEAFTYQETPAADSAEKENVSQEEAQAVTEEGAEPPETGENPGQAGTDETGGAEGVLQEGQTEIKLYLNGNRLVPEAVPYESGGLAFVPIGEICGYFSRSITCSQENGILTIVDEEKGRSIVIEAGSDKADVNGTEVRLEAPAALSSGGTVMTELSAFRSLLDADNKFQEDIGAAYITESGLC